MNKTVLYSAYPAVTLSRKPPVNITEADLHLFKKVLKKNLKPVTVFEYKNVCVTPEGIVFSSLHVEKDFLIYPHHTKIYNPLYVLSSRIKRKKIQLDSKEKYLLCFDYWSNSIFHWMCDALPRLQAVKEIAKDCILLIPEHFKYPYIHETLKAFNFKSIHVFGVNTYLECSTLIVPEQITVSGEINPENFKALRNTLLDYFNPKLSGKLNFPNIYISRSRAKYRKVVNEADLLPLLKKYDFTVIYFEDYTVAEQIEIAFNARNMISIHGANLTNAIFMKPEGNVLELRKQNDTENNYFYSIADSINCNYYYLNCQYNDPVPGENYFDVIVDLKKLEDLMGKMLSKPITPVGKKISFIVREDPQLLNDTIFSGNPLYGMKSDNYPFVAIKEKLEQAGVTIHTQDILPPSEADAVLCLDKYYLFKKFNVIDKPSFLIISEPPVYCPENWDVANHSSFNKIFTYDSNLVRNEKYVHYSFPIEFEFHPHFMEVSEELYKKRKLCLLVAGAIQLAKPSPENPSLLYERYLAIDWFGIHQPKELDLYGRNIDGKVFTDFRGAGLLKKLKLIALLNNIGSYYSYPIKRLFKGAIPPLEKNSYQQKYNFSICYENTKHINGCISERIFDSFASSNVPIYLGAPDIKKWIPENCFIDKRNFKSYKQLYDYIRHMPYEEYQGYIEAIKKFLNSKEINIFRTATYSSKITEQILKEL